MDELEGIQGRETQPYSDMMIGEGYRLGESYSPETDNIPGFKQTTNFRPKYAKDTEKEEKKRTIGKFFSNMSRLGMNYDDMVIKNMRAIPADKNLLPKDQQLNNQDIFSQMLSNWKVKDNKDKNFFEKDFQAKREVLRKLSLQPELEDILDKVANESIVYDSNLAFFAEPVIDPKDLTEFDKGFKDKIQESMKKRYYELYKMLRWKTHAWDDFKRYLIEGILAYEIVYDRLDKPTKIIGIIPLDPATLTKKFDNNKWYWIQFKGIQGKERKLLDAQVIYIQYQETESSSRLSYLERLIRPFNIYRIIEQAQIIWTVTNASFKMKFTIPVKGMNRATGSQTLMSAMNKWKEDIKFESETGELTFNGQANQLFNREIWMPETDAGSPEIEVLGGEGPELNDSEQLKFFRNNLYKMSKVPLNRFDAESGTTWFGTDAASVERDEIDYGRFIDNNRNRFAQIILKPLTLWMCIDVPELMDHRDLLECVCLSFHTYNPFAEMLEIEMMQKRTEHIQQMKESMVDMDLNGNEIKFFSSKFLVQKYLKLSDADLELNDKLKKEEIKELALAGDPESAEEFNNQ